MSREDSLRSLSFKISGDERVVEFNGDGLDKNDVSTLLGTFNAIATEHMAAPNPEPVSLADAFLNFLPSDVRTEKADHPDNHNYQDTGIKHRRIKHLPEEWTKCYRTRYTCTNPTCNQRGTHYIPEGVDVVKCHNCKEELEVREATASGFPDKDSYNNFFVAGNGA